MCLLLCLFVDTSKYNPVFRSCPKPDYQNIFYLCKSQNFEGLLVITINTYTKTNAHISSNLNIHLFFPPSYSTCPTLQVLHVQFINNVFHKLRVVPGSLQILVNQTRMKHWYISNNHSSFIISTEKSL